MELMSQKAEKPSLSGQRLKTRKRDEKEKYDPSAFRDAVIAGLNETGADLELVSKFLDASKLDYRRYSDVLFDILFAGGQLAPGGSILEDPDQTRVSRTDVCVFGCEDDRAKLRAFFDVFNKLIRRYKYLERSFEDSVKKILVFLRGFKEDEQTKLAKILGIILGNGFCKPHAISSIFEEHLVKEGISLRFATVLFRSWLEEKDIASVVNSLKKAQLDNRLLELFPMNKRNHDVFAAHFGKEGLDSLVNFQGKQMQVEMKKELQNTLSEMLEGDEPVKEIVMYLDEQLQKNSMQDTEIVFYVWNTLMSQVELNKKEELAAEQALKHLNRYAVVLGAVTKSRTAESKLIIKIQEYCYDNMAFQKVFQKIVVLLYKTDVLSEETILAWNNGAHSAKGKTVFLDQMKSFIEWLKNAEEESDEED